MADPGDATLLLLSEELSELLGEGGMWWSIGGEHGSDLIAD